MAWASKNSRELTSADFIQPAAGIPALLSRRLDDNDRGILGWLAQL